MRVVFWVKVRIRFRSRRLIVMIRDRVRVY